MHTVRHYSMLIGGDWVDAEERFEIRSPATEELVASVAKGGREHADLAVAAAKAAHADGRWCRKPPAQRAAVLGAIADRLSERAGDLAVLEALENGAPVRQAGAFQVGFSIAHRRPQRYDDRPRGDLRPSPRGDPGREYRAGGPDRQRRRPVLGNDGSASEFGPLVAMAPVRTLGGLYAVADITLPLGTPVRDYLAEAEVAEQPAFT